MTKLIITPPTNFKTVSQLDYSTIKGLLMELAQTTLCEFNKAQDKGKEEICKVSIRAKARIETFRYIVSRVSDLPPDIQKEIFQDFD